MRFGIFTGMGNTTWDTVLDLWRHAAASGWDAACVTDHFMPNTPDRVGDTMECWTTLAALAAVVPKMRLGTIVSGNTYRHPAVLAKMAAQVDVISGAGSSAASGPRGSRTSTRPTAFPSTPSPSASRASTRRASAQDALDAGHEHPQGRYYQLSDAPLAPKPCNVRIPS